MRGGRHLLLLAVLLLLERSQQKPKVMMSPMMPNEIYSGDSFYLKCEDGTNGSQVKWYFNDMHTLMTEHYKIAVANQIHSGKYECEVNGEKSDPFNLQVRDFEPSALLTIKTGQPVMQTGGSVVLSLQHDDGLLGWMCWVRRGDKVRKIKLRNTTDTSLDFQPNRLQVPETTFWCNHAKKNIRSNQITVRTSVKPVSLEMYPLHPIDGEGLSLRCLTWGTHLLSRAVFYKNNQRLSEGSKEFYNIPSVTEADVGSYKCHAEFKYIANPTGRLYEEDSDTQELLILRHSMKAFVTAGMSCSCERCENDALSHWYMKSGESWVHVGSSTGNMSPEKSGTYACRKVWRNGRSSLSRAFAYEPQTSNSPVVITVLVIVLLVIIVVAVGIFIWRKKSSATGAIYEDVALRARDKGDPEYDTLDPETPNRKKGEKEGEYEPLKKEETKGGEYQTLGTERGAGGEGGYEALKKEGQKEGVYHTLGTEGAAGGGGEGGYEALKKEGQKEGVYHTLKTEGAAGGGGEGGYEALKKEGQKEGVYHTLGGEGAAGGGEDTKQ